MEEVSISSEATADALAIISRVQSVLQNATEGEVHLFAYLSCLLWLYKGNPAAEWGYEFSATLTGAPFSTAVGEATKLLRQYGKLHKAGEYMRLTPDGDALYDKLHTLDQFRIRYPYIDGACGSLFGMPVGLVRDAVNNEPGLRRAGVMHSKRRLLQEPDKEDLFDQFMALIEAIGVSSSELMIPALVWLRYLSCAKPEGVVDLLSEEDDR